MSRLLRLYPAAWRERYEGEFIGTLQERPVGLAGSVDVVHGAIDAHLHPELTGGAPHVWTHRLPGLLATAAGLIWSWYYLRIVLAAPEEWGYGVLLAMLLMLFSVLGDYMFSYARQIGLTMSALIATAVLAGVQPLSVVGGGLLNFALGAAAALLLSGGMLTLAALRAGIGTGARWLLITGGLLVPVTVAIPVMGGFGPTDPGGAPAMVVAILPYGIAWAIIGLRMTLRGSVTIHDTPPTEPASEAAAA
jgi:hypothetical protein